MTNIDPSYYKDKNGKDLFDEIEEKYTSKQVVTIYGFNIKKYVKRFMKKDGLDDLAKARKYVSQLQNYLDDDQCDAVSDWLNDLTDEYKVIRCHSQMVSDNVDKIITSQGGRFNDKDIIHEDKRLKPNDLTVEQRNQCMKDLKSMLRVFLNAPNLDYCSKNDLYHKVVQLEDEYHLESLADTIRYCVDFDSFPSTETCMWLSYSPCTDTDASIMDLIKKWDGEDYTNY